MILMLEALIEDPAYAVFGAYTYATPPIRGFSDGTALAAFIERQPWVLKIPSLSRKVDQCEEGVITVFELVNSMVDILATARLRDLKA